jgi:hypothetical protein
MRKFFRDAVLILATPAAAFGQNYGNQWQDNVQLNDNSITQIQQNNLTVIVPPVQATTSHGPADLAQYARRALQDGQVGYEEVWVGPRYISRHVVLLTTPGDHNDDWTVISRATGEVLSHKTVNITHSN